MEVNGEVHIYGKGNPLQERDLSIITIYQV